MRRCTSRGFTSLDHFGERPRYDHFDVRLERRPLGREIGEIPFDRRVQRLFDVAEFLLGVRTRLVATPRFATDVGLDVVPVDAVVCRDFLSFQTNILRLEVRSTTPAGENRAANKRLFAEKHGPAGSNRSRISQLESRRLMT